MKAIFNFKSYLTRLRGLMSNFSRHSVVNQWSLSRLSVVSQSSPSGLHCTRLHRTLTMLLLLLCVGVGNAWGTEDDSIALDSTQITCDSVISQSSNVAQNKDITCCAHQSWLHTDYDIVVLFSLLVFIVLFIISYLMSMKYKCNLKKTTDKLENSDKSQTKSPTKKNIFEERNKFVNCHTFALTILIFIFAGLANYWVCYLAAIILLFIFIMSADDRIGDSIKLLFSAYKNIRWNDIPMLDSSTDSKEKDGTGDISEGSEETEDSFSEQKVKEITIQYLNRFYHGTYGPTSTTIHNRHLVFDAVYESSNYDAVFEIKYYKNKDTIKVEDIQNILDRSSYLVNQSRKKIVIFLILVFDKESEKINVEKQVSKLNSMYSDILKIRTLSIEEINNKSI